MTHRATTRHISMALAATFSMLLSTGCLVSDSSGPGDSLVDTAEVSPGEQCSYGGLRIRSGQDKDGNGSLSGDEVSNVSYACNARVDGKSSLVDVKAAAPADCAAGGVAIHSGVDDDDNGNLDAAEVDDVEVICDGERGERGSDGSDGTNGTDGTNGQDGADGEDGYTTLVDLTEVSPDPAGACTFGGTRIDSGLDTNRNGTLDASEIDHTRHVCSVHTNDRMTLVEHSPEPVGPNCAEGGIKMEVGFDQNGNSQLDASEIQHTGYICNKVVLVEGRNSLVETSPASNSQCTAGGYVLKSGLDDNGDNTLDASEVKDTSIICNGQDGASALVETVATTGGRCGSGVKGYEILAGMDLDQNGSLSGNEVNSTTLICDGEDGFVGYDGRNSLVRTSSDGGVCPHGGFRFEAGLDQNQDDVLDANEVTSTEYVCDGYNGYDSLVEIGPHDGICVYDGFSVDVGLDTNADGVLNPSEVTNTAYVCDGLNGYDSLVEVTVDPIDCATTGLRFDTGLDTDADGILDFSEIQNTTIVCD